MATRCPICGENAFRERSGEFHFDPPPNVPGGAIAVSDSTWEECGACGEKILSAELEHALGQVRYVRLGLLPPDEIKTIRLRAGLSQVEMAQLLGVGDKTYGRWEAGKSLQNKSMDNLIRLVDRNQELFVRLEAQRNPDREALIAEYVHILPDLKGDSNLGMAAHGAEIDPSMSEKFRRRLRAIKFAQRG